MTLPESFGSALGNLAAHKLRSALTMLGMIFGVGAVIAMLSIGAGAERQALEMIERLGLRNVILRAKEMKDDELEEVRKKSQGLSWRDAQAIRDAIPGVELVAGRLAIEPYKVIATAAKTKAKVYGVSWRQAEISRMTLAEGRFFDALDERSHAQVCVIGPAVRRDLFGYGPAVGRDLKVNDVWLTVVGVLQDAGGGAAFEGVSLGSTADEVYVPVTTASRKFDRPPLKAPLDELIVRLDPSADPRAASGIVRELVERIHGGAGDFDLVVPEALLDQNRKTQRLFSIVMGCIASISLLVGGIGIMNIMLATVLERTREIGVRRAVGARRLDIRNQFIIESFSISAFGGVLGIAVGLVIAKAVAAYAGWPTVVTITSIALSTGVSVAVGLTSGIYPAVRAAGLDPIDALRYE
ncbi:MAG TPA: ABC transporter permease [Candidatus Polarisedimenticolaceae bacterium]|nr:ABC transporter permease [Candidatus Polarisedimenticolaceae bacterium]